MLKKILILVLIPIFSAPFFTFAQTGNHYGEREPITYRVEYLSPLGITEASETGIYFRPFGCCQSYSDTILPPHYFGEYPLYFSGAGFYFKVIIKNNSPRVYRNIKVETFQEFLSIEGGLGQAMGDSNENTWQVELLGPQEEITLNGEFSIPLISGSGIDQTHLRISHFTPQQNTNGQVILEDFQAGLWCPQKLYEAEKLYEAGPHTTL